MREESRDGFEFVPMLYPFNRKDAIKIGDDGHSIDDYRDYIIKQGIDKTEIIMPNLDILGFCPALKHLRICPSYNLSYVYSEKDRKHFNLKDKDLPKVNYVRGNEDIEEWRRLE